MIIFALLAISFVIYVLLDYIWIGILMQNFYSKSLSAVGLIENGKFKPRLLAMFAVYLSLSFLTVFHLIPKVTGFDKTSLLYTFLFGVAVYAFYEFTNYAIIRDWPKKIILIDILWGGVLVAIGSCLTFVISARIFF